MLFKVWSFAHGNRSTCRRCSSILRNHFPSSLKRIRKFYFLHALPAPELAAAISQNVRCEKRTPLHSREHLVEEMQHWGGHCRNRHTSQHVRSTKRLQLLQHFQDMNELTNRPRQLDNADHRMSGSMHEPLQVREFCSIRDPGPGIADRRTVDEPAFFSCQLYKLNAQPFNSVRQCKPISSSRALHLYTSPTLIQLKTQLTSQPMHINTTPALTTSRGMVSEYL